MTDQDQDLARRAVLCDGWRWMPGMTYWIDPWRADRFDYCLPDLSDPCTLGGLLALVREAWDDPHMHVYPDLAWCVYNFKSTSLPVCVGKGDTEAEALVAALEAAP